MVLVFVVFIGTVALTNDDDQTPQKIDVVTNTDGSYFELGGDFLIESDILSVSLTSDGRMAFSLSNDVSSQYNYYSWSLTDENHTAYTTLSNGSGYVQYTGDSIAKTDLIMYYISQMPGEYKISVKCYIDNNGQHIYKTTYSGSVTYVGEITEKYTWKYLGKTYNAQVSFNFADYLHYKNLNKNSRAVTTYSKVVSFITYSDPTVIELANALKKAYGGNNTAGQDFASFILAFVQICFDYPPYIDTLSADMYQYGQDEYFAYPLEAIYYGMGDCEDTSILAAALFEACGYDAGVLILPGHAMAAVGLNSYTPEVYSHYLFEMISKTINGVTYYACETTIDPPTPFQGIGLVDSSGDNGKPYSSYVGHDGYGFYVI